MKFQIVIAVLAALLMPAHGALRQCAGTSTDKKYEPSGFLTADFTQNACKASGGSIDPSTKGNQKCCNVPDARQGQFNDSCNKQKGGANFSMYHPTAQPC
ncbi:hypothetical protein DVH05_016929 [Phytophthora capsici]|nr:hypothetical protein DVH05_016929 [Phytophthora capsici]|eukprot:jgi/Phyca11/96849/e_gw1.1.1775.1